MFISVQNKGEAAKADRKALHKDALYLLKVYALRIAQRCLFFLPIKSNRILLYVNQRKGFVCNPKYIALELLRRYGSRIELIWVTEYPEYAASIEKMGIRVVRANSWRHWMYQLTAKAVIVNDAFHEAVILRRKQVTMNTWHAGMNYKKIGPKHVAFRNALHEKQLALRNIQPDIYLSGSQYFTEDTARSFGFNLLSFVATGSPKNDIFYCNVNNLQQSIRNQYHLDQSSKLALYAPTFRRGYGDDVHLIDFERLSHSLFQRFGGQWIILYRRHYFIKEENAILPSNVIDVSNYDDVNELLSVSDALISDYSSCLWDFSITGRPSFVYAPDIDYYRESDRGLSYPLEKWPYPISKSNDDLEDSILGFDEADYSRKIEAHHRDAMMYDDGCASMRAVDMLVGRMDLPHVE